MRDFFCNQTKHWYNESLEFFNKNTEQIWLCHKFTASPAIYSHCHWLPPIYSNSSHLQPFRASYSHSNYLQQFTYISAMYKIIPSLRSFTVISSQVQSYSAMPGIYSHLQPSSHFHHFSYFHPFTAISNHIWTFQQRPAISCHFQPFLPFRKFSAISSQFELYPAISSHVQPFSAMSNHSSHLQPCLAI